MIKMNKDTCLQALYGGLLLGGGGGGALKDGIATLDEVLKYADTLELKSIDELEDSEILINASMVGAPSSQERYVTAEHWKTNLKNFLAAYDGKQIAGIITNENGGMATANGWLVSAVTGVPIVDAPSNGRAQPTSTMGSMSLSLMPEYQTVQCCCGGKGPNYLEVVAKGNLSTTAKLIRQTAVFNGGMGAVLRNPVTVEYVKKNGAIGAITQAIEIGKLILPLIGNKDSVVAALHEKYQAEMIYSGMISEYNLATEGGFDVGDIHLQTDNYNDYMLTFWNEYMTLERDGRRIATFPDLICTLDATSGMPLSSAEAACGQDVAVIVIPRSELKLGAGMFIKPLFEEVEAIIHKDMTSYCSFR